MQDVSAALAAQVKEGRLVGALRRRTCGRLRRPGAKVLALAAGTLRWRPSKERPYRPRPKAPREAAPTPAAAPARTLVLSAQTRPLQSGLKQAAGHLRPFGCYFVRYQGDRASPRGPKVVPCAAPVYAAP